MAEIHTIGTKIRKWSRSIHRDLSFFFAGVMLIYAMSGFMLNHKRDFNSNYTITQWEAPLKEGFPTSGEQWTQDIVKTQLLSLGEDGTFMKFYQPKEGEIKVFIRRGTTMSFNLENGTATFEQLKKRPILSSLNRLHYNPSRWWTIFSDIFLVSFIIVILSGMVMLKGKHGFWGRGGIEFLIGILIPILFIFLL